MRLVGWGNRHRWGSPRLLRPQHGLAKASRRGMCWPASKVRSARVQGRYLAWSLCRPWAPCAKGGSVSAVALFGPRTGRFGSQQLCLGSGAQRCRGVAWRGAATPLCQPRRIGAGTLTAAVHAAHDETNTLPTLPPTWPAALAGRRLDSPPPCSSLGVPRPTAASLNCLQTWRRGGAAIAFASSASPSHCSSRIASCTVA